MDTSIPIYNLYYLLCYAWDRLEERDLVDVVGGEPPRDTLNLFGRVLGSGVRALIRRGFERGYLEKQQELAGIRGKIIVGATVRKQLPQYGRAECAHDELEYDTPANRIILSTLSLLARSPCVEGPLRHELSGLRAHFRDVRAIRVTSTDCRRVMIHRNNRHYGFIIDLCELILRMVLPDENGAENRFLDFTRDHQAMAGLFEKFVRQFYMSHAEECGVLKLDSRQIQWNGTAQDARSKDLWPTMNTDICLIRRGNPLVIDCKFYTDAVKQGRHGNERISSANLYQLFTYTSNLACVPGWKNVEGLLLYAQNGDHLEISHTACGHKLRASTVDLNLPWKQIHDRLVHLAKITA